MRCLFITFESQHGWFLVDYWYQNRFSGSSSIKEEFPSNTYRGGPAWLPLAKHPTTLIKPTLKKTLPFVSVLERLHTLDVFFYLLRPIVKGFVRQVLKFLLQLFAFFLSAWRHGINRRLFPRPQATLTTSKWYGKIKLVCLVFFFLHFIKSYLTVSFIHIFLSNCLILVKSILMIQKSFTLSSLWHVKGFKHKNLVFLQNIHCLAFFFI